MSGEKFQGEPAVEAIPDHCVAITVRFFRFGALSSLKGVTRMTGEKTTRELGLTRRTGT
ncbi:MAG: hypothetical protein RQM90_09085 [Methanoculleus sp.]